MTTNHTDDELIDDALKISARRVSMAAEEARQFLDRIERSRAEQPERLAKARSDAEEARGWALLEEPLESQVTPLDSADGHVSLKIPNVLAKDSVEPGWHSTCSTAATTSTKSTRPSRGCSLQPAAIPE